MSTHDDKSPAEAEVPDDKNVIIIAVMSVSAVLVAYLVVSEAVIEPLRGAEWNLLHVLIGSGFSLVMLGVTGFYLHHILRERQPSVLADEVSPTVARASSAMLVLFGVGLALYDLHQWLQGEGAAHLLLGIFWLCAAAGYLVYEKMKPSPGHPKDSSPDTGDE